MSNKVYVLYHANCHDGAMAAALARKEIRKFKYEPIMIPSSYGNHIPDIEIDSLVYIVDFSFKEKETRQLSAIARKLIIIDHHITAQEEYEKFKDLDNIHFVFDINVSGVYGVWNYFHEDEAPPYSVKLVSDRDLFAFKYNDDTRNLYSYMQTLEYDLDKYEEILNSVGLTMFLEIGKNCRKLHEALVNNYVKNPITEVELNGNRMKLFNLQFEFGSDVCNLYLQQNPEEKFVAYFLMTNDNEVNFGLRSLIPKNDVSEIAKFYNGGGHKCASGFKLTLGQFYRLIKK